MPTKKPKVLSALPVLGHPRDSKRITMLQEAGFEVVAVAFERKYHSGRLPDCPVQTLGVIDHGKYFLRGLKMVRAMPSIRKAMARNHLVYASGADMALICLVSGLGLGRPVVVEIGDVRELQVAEGLKGRIVRAIDKRMVEACRLLVVTAPRFLDIYYRQWLKARTPGLVIENKLEASVVAENKSKTLPAVTGTPLVDRPLRIGYFGLLRDEWSWQVLEALATSFPDRMEIVFAGLPMAPLGDLPLRVATHANMEYRGEYRSPDDLPSLYNCVDMVWACYPPIKADDWNLRWARPNRFYESCLFQKPTFTRAGCQDAVDVERYMIGMIIDGHDVHRVAAAIGNVTPGDWECWRSNMKSLPCEVYMYTTEVDELRDALSEIVRNKIAFNGAQPFPCY